MNTYDLVVPLGEFCASAIALKNAEIRKASYPFDWSGGKLWDKCGVGGFIGKIKLICNNFENAFELKDLTEFWSEQKEHRSIVNQYTGLMYLHEFPWNKSIEAHYPEFKEKYLRRVQRLYSDIEQSKRILFVFATRLETRVPICDIEEGYNLLIKEFPDKDIHFLIIFDAQELNNFQFHLYQHTSHIDIVLYRDIPLSGDGNQEMLQRIFKMYNQNIYQISFNKNDVVHIGLSFKEDWGRWSDGKEVYLSVPMPYVGENVILDFNVMPFPSENGKQSVAIKANGQQVMNYEFKKFGEQNLSFSIDKLSNVHKTLELQFSIALPSHPVAYDKNDKRLLGLGFRTLTIRRETNAK